MRLHILSDLHLECHVPKKPLANADVVVLAGDIHRGGIDGIEWSARMWPDRPVIYVPGNHEYAGTDYLQHRERMAEAASRHSNLHFLDRGAIVIDDIAFIGATLWTDFMYSAQTGDYVARHMALADAAEFMPDYREITIGGRPLMPEDTAKIFAIEHAYLRDILSLDDYDFAERLGAEFVRKRVVITHHLPSALSVNPRHAYSPLTPAYASRIDDTVKLADVWVHGHTHHSCDYEIRGAESHITRVVCNPRGYSSHRMTENERYRPGLVVEI